MGHSNILLNRSLKGTLYLWTHVGDRRFDSRQGIDGNYILISFAGNFWNITGVLRKSHETSSNNLASTEIPFLAKMVFFKCLESFRSLSIIQLQELIEKVSAWLKCNRLKSILRWSTQNNFQGWFANDGFKNLSRQMTFWLLLSTKNMY